MGAEDRDLPPWLAAAIRAYAIHRLDYQHGAGFSLVTDKSQYRTLIDLPEQVTNLS